MHPSYPCGHSWSPYEGGVQEHFLHWTGDNSAVAFDLGPETWTADATGAAVQRVADADPGDEYDVSHYGHYADISPDGNRVVYSTCKYTVFDHDRVGWRYNLGYEIASVNVDGSDRQRLTNNVHFENYPVWSPDGVRIAFIAHNDYNGLADYGYYASLITTTCRMPRSSRGPRMEPTRGWFRTQRGAAFTRRCGHLTGSAWRSRRIED